MPSEATTGVYFLIMLISGVLNVALVLIVIAQREDLKDLLQRRNCKTKPDEQQTETSCNKDCKKYCRFEQEIIPELQNDVETYKSLYMEEQKINAILESTNAKLRMKNMEEYND